MSVENIYNDLYPFLIKDWKNTSLIINKETSQKSFPMVLKKFIEYSSERSKYALDLEALTYFQNNVLEENGNDDLKRVFNNMVSRYEDILRLEPIYFSLQVIDELSKKHNYITSLKPQGWENFILQNKNKKIDLTEYNNNWSYKRSSSFAGIQFIDDDFGFYDKISLFVTAKKYLENDIPPYYTLFKSIAQYVFNYNKKVNTSEIIRNIDDLLYSGITDKNIKLYFNNYLNSDDIKLDFEILEKQERNKEDLNSILKKLTKVK